MSSGRRCAAGTNFSISLVTRLPDEVVTRDIKSVTRFGMYPQDGLRPIMLDGHDARNSICIEYLSTDCILLDKSTDRHGAIRGADERVEGLARAALLRDARDADVEPDRES
jgi:hypothetical protein